MTEGSYIEPGSRPGRSAEMVALIERLKMNIPAAMRDVRQWLLWRFEAQEGRPKPLKVPYYVNGKKRTGKQGDERDRASLTSFEDAMEGMQKIPTDGLAYQGLGFAFLPGDGLVGIDIDAAIDAETGEVSSRCQSIIEACASYTELSPSGTGVHIIVKGNTQTFKDNGIGLEVFCERQYFTCTGRRWPGAALEVTELQEGTLKRLQATVRAAKEARRAVLPATPTHTPPEHEDVRNKLEEALRYVSADLGHDDWVHVGMGIKAALHESGFSLWDYWSSKGSKYPGSAALARKWESFRGTGFTEATVFKFAMDGGWKPRRLTLVKASPKQSKSSDSARRPAPPDEDDAQQPQDGSAPAHDDGGEGEGRAPTKRRPKFDSFNRLLNGFSLIYGTDQVWDAETQRILKVSNVRLIFGSDAVRMWLADLRRKVVMPEHVVFEPGVELPEGHVNLYNGLALEPLPATDVDVAPMLELLHHLCSTSADSDVGVEAVTTWVLRWVAILVQRPGVKLKTAMVFHGPQGAGKNLFFDALRTLFGKYGVMVGQNELEDKFNDWLSAKLLVIGNEVVTRQELYHNKNKLKWVISDDQIPIRAQHSAVRWESNHANLVFLSNEHQPVALEYGDRRHLVIYTPMGRADDLYKRVRHFLDHEDGVRKWLGYLLTVDLGDFEPYQHPPMTAAKEVLIELGLKPPERFVSEWIAGYLPLPIQVCSVEQLYRAFRKWCDSTGERFPPNQPTFTRTAEKFMSETAGKDPTTGEPHEPRLRHKVITLKDISAGGRKSTRCWIPRGDGPPDGMSEGEWAWRSVEDFERAVNRMCRSPAMEGPET